MSDLTCRIQDPDNFSSKLLAQFITQTSGLSLLEKEGKHHADVLFVDADQVELNASITIDPSTQIVVVSSNNQYVYSLFKDHIADYLSKSELTYSRFLIAIERIKTKATS